MGIAQGKGLLYNLMFLNTDNHPHQTSDVICRIAKLCTGFLL